MNQVHRRTINLAAQMIEPIKRPFLRPPIECRTPIIDELSQVVR
jgi:hypothetical protein